MGENARVTYVAVLIEAEIELRGRPHSNTDMDRVTVKYINSSRDRNMSRI